MMHLFWLSQSQDSIGLFNQNTILPLERVRAVPGPAREVFRTKCLLSNQRSRLQDGPGQSKCFYKWFITLLHPLHFYRQIRSVEVLPWSFLQGSFSFPSFFLLNCSSSVHQVMLTRPPSPIKLFVHQISQQLVKDALKRYCPTWPSRKPVYFVRREISTWPT